MLATAEIAQSLRPAALGSSFGGNPIACRAGMATIETIEEDGLLERGLAIGERFRTQFEALRLELPERIREVRVRGVMVGLDLTFDASDVVSECLKRLLLINATHGHVVRLLPALTISDELIDQGCAILADVLREMVV